MAATMLSFSRLLFLGCAGLASLPGTAESLFADGKLLLDVRLRYEAVDDGAFAADAEALTLRTRLGWRSGSVNGFHFVVEGEDVRALEERYNSTANGRTRYPAVADPEGSEWNQAYLGWQYAANGQLQIGRQRILIDNQRFVGNVGWRQNEQTFDAVSVNHVFNEQWTLRYAWLDRAHRVFGNNHPNPLQAEHDLDAHLLNLGYKTTLGTVSGYSYLIENEDLPASSTSTQGVRFTGSVKQDDRVEWLYSAELAQQRGWRDAPGTGSVGYRLLEAGARLRGHALRIGNEQLDANGRRAFQTPLATGHAFNGWADRFLVTPAGGLDDRYVKVDGPLGPLRYLVAWHDFDAARGSASYGRELDAQLSWAFRPKWNALVKLADYRSDGFGSDQRKMVLSVEYRY
jgi:hypothetical protein